MFFPRDRQSCGERRGPAPENVSARQRAQTFCCATVLNLERGGPGVFVKLADFIRAQVRVLVYADFDEFWRATFENPSKRHLRCAIRGGGKRRTSHQAGCPNRQQKPPGKSSHHHFCKSLTKPFGCVATRHALRGPFEGKPLDRRNADSLQAAAAWQVPLPAATGSIAAPAPFASGTRPAPKRRQRPAAREWHPSRAARAP